MAVTAAAKAKTAVDTATASVEASRDRDNYAQEDNLAQHQQEQADAQQALAAAQASSREADAKLEVADATADAAAASDDVDLAKASVTETATRDNYAQQDHLDLTEAAKAAADARLAQAQTGLAALNEPPLYDVALAPPAGKQGQAVVQSPRGEAAPQAEPEGRGPGREGPGVPHALYPQLVLPPEYAAYAQTQRVTDVRPANENNEAAGGFLGGMIPAAGIGLSQGGPRAGLVTGFLGGSVGGVISGVGYRWGHDQVYAFGLPGDEDNMATTIVCTLPKDAPAGTVMQCKPYDPSTEIPFRGWEDRALGLVAGNGDTTTATPRFTGPPSPASRPTTWPPRAGRTRARSTPGCATRRPGRRGAA
jgi:hypothetical protein